MRYRKRIKIAKGIGINVSKTGLSLTAGVRGASMNFGKKGAYLNTGIPGTGLYNRQRIGSSPSSSKSYASAPRRTSSVMPSSIGIGIESNGNVVIMDENNMVITDQFMLSKIKSTEAYKNQLALMMNQHKELIEKETREFVDIYKLSEYVQPLEQYQERLNNLKPEKFKKTPLNDVEPQMHSIRSDLEAEAKEKVKTLLFWKAKKLRENYVEEKVVSRYDAAHSKWKEKKEKHEKAQSEEEEKMNEQYRQEYELIKEIITKAIDGNKDYIQNGIESWLASVELPVEFDVQYEFVEDTCNLMLDMELPVIEDIPSEKAFQSAKGDVKRKAKTQKEIKFDYICCVLGLSVFFSSYFFNISPVMSDILVSGYTKRRNNNTGDIQEDYIYSVKFKRSGFEVVDFNRINLIDFWHGFENRILTTQNNDMKTIIPFE